MYITKKDRSELAETSVSANDTTGASEHKCSFASPNEFKGLPVGKSKRDTKRNQKALDYETIFVRPRSHNLITSSSTRDDF